MPKRDFPSNKTTKLGPVLVVSRANGLTYQGALHRVRDTHQLPDLRSILDADDRQTWGNENTWTPRDVQKALVRLVSEGITIRKALASLETAEGPMPSFYQVAKWLEQDKIFEKEMRAAERCAAEILADAAMEAALEEDSPLPAVVAGRKLRAQALQWRAARMHKDKFGESQKVEINDNRPFAAVNPARLKAELSALMSDPMVKSMLEAQDAEIVEPPPQPALSHTEEQGDELRPEG